MKAFVSILIPTYNRSRFLKRLLSALENELAHSDKGHVEVLIGDNCSEDDTYDSAACFITRNITWKLFRRPTNLGAEENMLRLIESASGSYCWMIGDDDLPKLGLIPLLLDYITSKKPSLLYLPSLWSSRFLFHDILPVQGLEAVSCHALAYARSLNVRTTFISSWIINFDELRSNNVTIDSIRSNKGSNLVHLGLVLPLLLHPNSRLYKCEGECIYATSGNTGGYQIIRTFCANYPEIVTKYASKQPRMMRALVAPYLTGYLPGLIIDFRCNGFRDSRGSKDDLLCIIRALSPYPAFWFICLPLLLMPQPILVILRRLRRFSKLYAYMT